MKIDYKPLSQAEYQLKQDRKREKSVRGDIKEIEAVIESNDEAKLLEVHRDIDGKYQSCIKDWGKSMYVYNPEFGFAPDMLERESLISNLKLMKSKLQAYKQNWNSTTFRKSMSSGKQVQNLNVSLKNETAINISISFEEACKEIENMTALSKSETDDIIAKIDELKSIATADSSKKAKWESIKPILQFVTDKGVDVAMVIIKLISQMI